MLKKLLFPLLILFVVTAANAQLNNSWIDYSKTYYKFKIYSDTMVRIPQTTLVSVGLGTTNADHFQLWRNGQQVRLYTSVNAAPLGASDFIEFFGLMNDGKADAPLYRQPSFQQADKYSLETDTSTYFLTVNPSGGNLRYNNVVNTAPSATTPDAYFMRNVDVYYKNKLNNGYANNFGEYVYSSSYDNGEGFTSNEIVSKVDTFNVLTEGFYTENISNLNVYSSGPLNSLSVSLKMFTNSAGNFRKIGVKLFNNIIYPETTTNGTSDLNVNATNLPLIYLQNTSSAQINFNIKNLGVFYPTQPYQSAPNYVPNERMVIANIGLTYPATFNFNNTKSFGFSLGASATGNYLVIDNFNYGSTAPILYDINNGKRYIGEIASTPGKVKFVLPASSDQARKFILNNVENINVVSVTSLVAKTFIDLNTAATRGDYIIISNPVLYNDGTGANPVNDYKNYRSSINGGSYNAKVVDINELRDQFAFGIKSHPAAIKDFVKFMDAQYPTKPKFIFLIGRGIAFQERRGLDILDPNTFATNLPIADKLDLIPTFGWPPSDVMLASPGLNSVPTTPIGRLGAVTGAEVRVYLQKIMEYEAEQKRQSPLISEKAWMKNIMQITGGRTTDDQALFGSYVDNYAAIAGVHFDGSYLPPADTLFGGNVEQFKKTSSSTVQQASSERITQLFQEGIGFIQYFGHSSATVFEFNLGSPENYNNPGRYPFFNISGCLAGNYYTFDPQRLLSYTTLSEKYLFTPQRGSIGFLADTHYGIPGDLDGYNFRLHQNFCQINYGKTIGEQIKETINYEGGNNPSISHEQRIHLEEINLHGDPALKIINFDKPDYVIEPQLVTISPSILTTASTFFTLKVKYQNIGRAVKDSIRIYVKRLKPGASTATTIYDELVPGAKYADSIFLNIPIDAATDGGLNRLTIELDYTHLVPELYETNNFYGTDVFIFQNTINPVFPYEYAIVNNPNILFTASTSDPLLQQSNFSMELDTTELFNSPFKKTYNKTGIGGVVEFTPTGYTPTDSTVYYWRTTILSATGPILWNKSSFTYLPASSTGFNQGHYYQFLKNQNNDIDLTANRKFVFKPRNVSYTIRTAIYPYAGSTSLFSISNGGFMEQNGLSGPSATNSNSLRFYIVDSLTLKPWYNQAVGAGGQYGSQAPLAIGGGKPGYFQFDISTSAARQVVKDFIDAVPNGNVIIMVNCGSTINNFLPAQWATDPGSNMYLRLKSLGFNDIDLLTIHKPFIFAARKGVPIAIAQTISGSVSEFTNVTFNISGSALSGNIVSDVFGPAKKWNELHWRGNSIENPSTDKTRIDIIGLNINGNEDSLSTVNLARDTTIEWIDATTYPKLRLKLVMSDSTNATPHQLCYLRLNADLMPEGALAPSILFSMKDTVQAGEDIDFAVAFKNVGPVKFDSTMKFSLIIKNSSNVDNIIPIPRGKILMVGDTLKISAKIITQNFIGINTLALDVNPMNHQPEQFHFNNILLKTFFVKADVINPLLDVTFDGVHILNRDIVSSKPDILIKLKDENKYLGLTDNSLLKVQLKYPDNTIRDYNFNTDTLRFTPANLAAGENTASINFKPVLLKDGDYQLIVTGKDRSGNKAGALNYNSVFTVINKPMISEMLNYPNPFTTSTAFVFTLTGSEVPQNIRIQVLTITGKVVREILKDELGPLHIGRNITSFKWDGTDTYGQQLANGVYIYRVLTNLNGNSLEKYKARGDDTEKYFNKGYGKMYLMR